MSSNYRFRPEHHREPLSYQQDQLHVLDGRNAVDRPLTIIRERLPPHSGGDAATFVRTVPRHDIVTLE